MFFLLNSQRTVIPVVIVVVETKTRIERKIVIEIKKEIRTENIKTTRRKRIIKVIPHPVRIKRKKRIGNTVIGMEHFLTFNYP